MCGIESAEAENVGGEERERELYPPPLLVVQNGEMRQRGVRDREREGEMDTGKGSKQRNIHMRNRQKKESKRPVFI